MTTIVHIDEQGRFRSEPLPTLRRDAGEKLDATRDRHGPYFVGCYYCGRRADLQSAGDAPRCAKCHDRYRRRD